MKGQILDFSLQKGGGLIQAESGKRYLFRASEWLHATAPSAGLVVEFEAADEKFAIQVKPVTTTKTPVSALTQKIKFASSTAHNATTTPDSINLWQHAVNAVKIKYTDFTGRSRRREYWGFFLFFNLISLGLLYLVLVGSTISKETANVLSLPYWLFCLAFFLPQLAVTVRRLHDINKSGWWILVGLIPLVGGIWLIILLCTDGTPDENQFGPNPKNVE